MTEDEIARLKARIAKLEHRLEIDRYFMQRDQAEKLGLTILEEETALRDSEFKTGLVCVAATEEERELEGIDKIACMEVTEAHMEELIADRHEAMEAIRGLVTSVWSSRENIGTTEAFAAGAKIIKILDAFQDNGKFYAWKVAKRKEKAEKARHEREGSEDAGEESE